MNAPGAADDRTGRLRVGFLSHAHTFGGHEAMAVTAAKALSARGDDVAFTAWRGNRRLLDALRAANAAGSRILVRETSVRDGRLNPFMAFLRWRDIRQARADLRIDPSRLHVLVQGRIESGAVAVLAAALEGTRLVSYLPMAHRLPDMGVRHLPRLRDALNRRYYRWMADFVTISRTAASQIHAFAPSAEVRIVENWIARPRPVERAPRPRPTVAIVGRVDFRQKGHDRLVGAMARAGGTPSAFDLVVVGDGPDLPALRARVADAGLAARVRFAGWVEGGLDALYAQADVVALPSHYEGVPLVMLEALARDIPAVGSAVDGMAEWLPGEALFARDAGADAIVAAIGFALGPAAPTAFREAFERARACTDLDRYGADWHAALDRFARAPAPR